MKTFANKEELLKEWETNGACKEGVEFNKSCKDLQEILEKCPLNFRLWRLQRGYVQFAEHCLWEELSGCDWSSLLSLQPQFADKCDWGKLYGDDWACLLFVEPQFADKCDWEKLNGIDWAYLLSGQPQFADKCDWEKLNDDDWNYLLYHWPKFKKFRKH